MNECDHDGGSLLPIQGTWTNAVEDEEHERELVCVSCQETFRVKRRNIKVERVEPVKNDYLS